MEGFDFYTKFWGRRFVLIAGFLLITVTAGAVVIHQKGRFTATLNQYSPLSNTNAVTERMKVYVTPGTINKHHYTIEMESFEVYVPQSYDPNTPYGLLVWIAAGPGGGIEHYPGFLDLMDKHKLIWVGANGAGNDTDVCRRRIALALDAAYNMPMYYSINPRRIYVSGISGGGRVASVAALHYSDVFNGGIFVIGANYWKPMSIPEKNVLWKASAPKPRPEYLKQAKENGRYVLLTGDNDSNRLQMHTYYEKGYRKDLDHVLYIQVPGMGHQCPPPEAFDEALGYVDGLVLQETKSKENTN